VFAALDLDAEVAFEALRPAHRGVPCAVSESRSIATAGRAM
jgi:hypothetical protein